MEPWTTTDCLLERHPELSDEEAQAALDAATWALWTLTGQKLHGHECWAEEYEVQGCDLRLAKGPVEAITKVEKVEPCGARERSEIGWCVTGPQSLDVCEGTSSGAWYRNNWGTSPCHKPDRVAVEYSIKSNLPPGSGAVVCRLASEYTKAAAGQACALPERITSVTRQGVSWTILDSQTFFDKGLIGVGSIDHWISIARMYAGSASLMDPLRGRIIRSQQLDCVETHMVTATAVPVTA